VGQIAANAGSTVSIVVDKVRTRTAAPAGYNALTNGTDLVQAGVARPAMVTRSALQNAASIGSHHHHRCSSGRARSG